MQDGAIEKARGLMQVFAEETGLSSSAHPPRRYLWTDAYAVCSFLELHRLTDQTHYRELALHLIEQAHWELGRFRADDSRKGWISGLDDAEGSKHPTAGGLRIGKKRAERKRGEAFDAQAEWDRDGQYFHYLTKWIHALMRTGAVMQDVKYVRWAAELADAAHAGFVYSATPDGRKQMYWKMSTDLSYALVPSMGHHDPLDGLVTINMLQVCAENMMVDHGFPNLERHVSDYMEMCAGRSCDTDDALGLGGLLFDAARIWRMIVSGRDFDFALLQEILTSAHRGMTTLLSANSLSLPADHRLAFRELGLAIGLHSIGSVMAFTGSKKLPPEEAGDVKRLLSEVARFLPLAKTVEMFWLNHENQQASTWRDHRDINTVMLASSLLPNSMLSSEECRV